MTSLASPSTLPLLSPPLSLSPSLFLLHTLSFSPSHTLSLSLSHTQKHKLGLDEFANIGLDNLVEVTVNPSPAVVSQAPLELLAGLTPFEFSCELPMLPAVKVFDGLSEKVPTSSLEVFSFNTTPGLPVDSNLVVDGLLFSKMPHNLTTPSHVDKVFDDMSEPSLTTALETPHVDFWLKLLGADAMSIPGLYSIVQVKIFYFEDKPLYGAVDVIKELKDRAKLHVMMLTGDHESSVWRVAKAVGIDEVHCSLKPEDKLNHVTSISRDTG